MNILVTPLVLALLLPAAPPSSRPSETPRKPNPLAPSLPELTEEEEEKLDQIIARFILADTGKLRGPEAKQATEDFKRLGPDATFALIRGMNKAAAINHSCPALTIAKKLSTILATTKDTQLLDYARENIGLGVERSKHMDAIKQLRLGAALRKGTVEKEKGTDLKGFPAPKGSSGMP